MLNTATLVRRWSQNFEARFDVVGTKMTITIPILPKINITSITPSMSNWIQIHGIIDEKQKLSSIPYIRNGSPDCSPSSCNTSCKRTEEERKKAKTQALT